MKIAIVENEDKDLNLYKEYIKQYQEETKEKIDFFIFHNGVDILSDYPKSLDAIFMDIDMPLINGLQTSEKIRAIDDEVIIIFVTNLASYAIKGYKVHALDFLLKPIQYNDFKFEMDKIKRNSTRKNLNFILVPQKGSAIKVNFKDIPFIEIFHHDVIIHTLDKEYKFRGSLMEMEERLPKGVFFRINNYAIINLSYVKEISKEDVILQNKENLPISRNRKKDFMDAFTFYMNGDLNNDN